MRDALIELLCRRMESDPEVFFVSADFGAPALDRLRADFPRRFVNVGIAEQNALNLATGLALEGFKVFVYGIAPFISMRCYEQARVDLSLLAQTRELNVNIISVGAGMSYDVSGPTHHCLEDVPLFRTLPNFRLFSPSDAYLVERFAEVCLAEPGPKYLRLDGKPAPVIYGPDADLDFGRGFSELAAGSGACLVCTGFMTRVGLEVRRALEARGVDLGVVDVYMLDSADAAALARVLSPYRVVLTLEEGFVGRGGLDSLVHHCLEGAARGPRVFGLGLPHRFFFDNGGREQLHRLAGIDAESVERAVLEKIKSSG